jgi:hypothetical protein
VMRGAHHADATGWRLPRLNSSGRRHCDRHRA